DDLEDPVAQAVSSPQPQFEPEPPAHTSTQGPAESIAAAAIRAPSGGNVQPWRVDVSDDAVTVALAPEHSATMDVAFRASAVAVGAALFNARVAAAAHGVLGQATVSEGSDVPLCAVLTLGSDRPTDLAQLYQPMLDRETNRHRGSGAPLDPRTADELTAAAAAHRGRLALLEDPEQIRACARILGAADRIRYLTPKLHAEMMKELRWPGDPSPDTGIDVRSLELNPGHWALADILRRSDVMAELSAWSGGGALGADTQARITSSSALAVVIVRGRALADYVRGGSAMEAVWVMAQQKGVAVQPISPVFLYAHDDAELAELSPSYVDELGALQREFIDLVGMDADESPVLVLRLFDGPNPSVRSRRRPLHAGATAAACAKDLP
ncbi:MAG TPA: hypothetical protein VFB19_11755, partial [Mycobacterium sp.]|nr:hypothetical protein [Mycobacterium sp.]